MLLVVGLIIFASFTAIALPRTRKPIITFFMNLLGKITNKIVKLDDLTKEKALSNYKILEYKLGGFMGELKFSMDINTDAPISISYELGDGKQTGNFLEFAKIERKQNAIEQKIRKISFSLFFGDDPCRIILRVLGPKNALGNIEILPNDAEVDYLFGANPLQVWGFRKRFSHIKLEDWKLSPYNEEKELAFTDSEKTDSEKEVFLYTDFSKKEKFLLFLEYISGGKLKFSFPKREANTKALKIYINTLCGGV